MKRQFANIERPQYGMTKAQAIQVKQFQIDKSKHQSDDNTFRVFTDGSAGNTPPFAGSHAAFIVAAPRAVPLLPSGDIQHGFKMVGGACWPTKVGRMELQAVVSALAYIRSLPLVFHEYYVEVNTDSQYVFDCATGNKDRTANRDLWAMYNHLSQGLNVIFRKVSRNTEGEQASADFVCDVARRKIIEVVHELEKLDEYKKMELRRDAPKETHETPV
jgi:ribonuclease HI